MEPGSTSPVTYLAGFLIGWGSVILPLMTITLHSNVNYNQSSHRILDSGGHELYSTSKLANVCPDS